jgi:hypothetical protein
MKRAEKISGRKVPIILCIDVEPDGMFIDRTRKVPWVGYEKAFVFFGHMRRIMASGTSSEVHLSWFYRMDPQVSETYGSGQWPVSHYSSFADELQKRGDAFGLHTHFYRFSSARNDWIIDNADEQWVDHCIRSSWEAFKGALGRSCDSHRFGDRLVTDFALHVIEEMGIRFDLSVEPEFNEVLPDFIRERMTGPIPKMTGVPKEPYRPSRTDFRKPDPGRKNGVWIIPLTTGKVRTKPKRLLSPRRLFSLHLGLEPQWFQAAANKVFTRSPKPYLGLVLKTDMLKDVRQASNMGMNLQYLANHPWARFFVFSTPEEAMRILGYL